MRRLACLLLLAVPALAQDRPLINKAVLRETSAEEWSELLERYVGR
ncbi:MAG: hypothetical protein ACYTF8_02770 [Planctomycetota bacterium]